MSLNRKIVNTAVLLLKMIRYNLKIVFANKFLYFLLAAFAFFILVTVIDLFSGSSTSVEDVYYLLLFPGILLIFYPTVFGIQNDEDARMLEIIFGIPNYRYKVWLVRLALIYAIVFLLLLALGWLSSFAMVRIPVFEIAFQLMFPIFFIGSVAFMFSTLIRNGNGTAVVMVVIGVGFLIAAEPLEDSAWNIFHNPFYLPRDMNQVIWAEVSLKNRLYLLTGLILSNLYGLFNLQSRERFV
ncbi:MAG: hypothetical protein JSV24_01845 [Bacteroidales bacterium]|nr:MAG: hypothetical protein JSV24_01845 [Bacteroidales bacterium]